MRQRVKAVYDDSMWSPERDQQIEALATKVRRQVALFGDVVRSAPQRADNRVHRVQEEGRDAQGGAAGGELSADENAAPNDREPHPLYGDIPLA